MKIVTFIVKYCTLRKDNISEYDNKSVEIIDTMIEMIKVDVLPSKIDQLEALGDITRD